jgi:hypothetical protein
MPEVPAARGDRLIRTGAVVCITGMVLTLVSLLPLVTDVELPSLFWALSMLVGVGFGLILLGLARRGRDRSRAQVAARTSATG